MKKTELIDRRFQELLKAGADVLATRRPPPPNVISDDGVDLDKSQEWETRTRQLLSDLFGNGSEYYRQFDKKYKYAGYCLTWYRGSQFFRRLGKITQADT